VDVFAGSWTKRAQSFFSRYISGAVVYPNPKNEAEFVSFLSGYCQDNRIDVVLPIGLDATTALSKHMTEFRVAAKIPIAPWDKMQVAADKAKSMRLAESVGVAVPRRFASAGEVSSYPVVVKGVEGSGKIRYVNSAKELEALDLSESLVQEYIPGEGYGFFALYSEGRLRASFMHRRLREYPATGGPSIAAESVRDPELEEAGLRLLDTLGWHGVVMAEFKKDSRDGRFKLMEINPKFWGSLELAVRAGIDFPYLTAKMAFEGDVEPVFEYGVGVRFKWVLPNEVLYAISRPSSTPSLLAELLDREFHKDISLDDLGPNLVQMASVPVALASRISKGSVAHPHGIPGGMG